MLFQGFIKEPFFIIIAVIAENENAGAEKKE